MSMADIETDGTNATIRPQPMVAEGGGAETITHNVGVMSVENVIRLWCPCGWMRVFQSNVPEDAATVTVLQLAGLNFYAEYHYAHPEEQ